jgi:hypothetical protein
MRRCSLEVTCTLTHPKCGRYAVGTGLKNKNELPKRQVSETDLIRTILLKVQIAQYRHTSGQRHREKNGIKETVCSCLFE